MVSTGCKSLLYFCSLFSTYACVHHFHWSYNCCVMIYSSPPHCALNLSYYYAAKPILNPYNFTRSSSCIWQQLSDYSCTLSCFPYSGFSLSSQSTILIKYSIYCGLLLLIFCIFFFSWILLIIKRLHFCSIMFCFCLCLFYWCSLYY